MQSLVGSSARAWRALVEYLEQSGDTIRAAVRG
jgi:hypothetical protein